jgi:MFS family permease
LRARRVDCYRSIVHERATIWATFRDSPVAARTILAGVFVNRLSGFLLVFLVLFLLSRGYSAGQAAFALGVYGVGEIASVLIGGAMAERLGARNAAAISMASTGVLTAALLYLPSYPLVLLAVALVSLFGQLFRPASVTLLSHLTREDRQVMIFAMWRFGLNLGGLAAPLIGYALLELDHQRYDLLFWGEALAALLYGLVAWLTLPARGPLTAAPAPGTEEDPRTDGGYQAVIRDRRYALFLVAILLHGAVYVQSLSTLPLTISAAGLPILWYTVAISLNGVIVIAFELLMTRVTQRFPRPLVVGLGFALVGAGMAVYGLRISPAIVVAGTLVLSLGEIIGGPTIFAYPAVAAPGRLKGRYIGSFQFMLGLGQTVGPAAGGWLFVEIGHLVWPVVAVGSLLATVCGLAAMRTPARRPPPD